MTYNPYAQTLAASDCLMPIAWYADRPFAPRPLVRSADNLRA